MIVILASYKFHLIRVHDNQIQVIINLLLLVYCPVYYFFFLNHIVIKDNSEENNVSENPINNINHSQHNSKGISLF